MQVYETYVKIGNDLITFESIWYMIPDYSEWYLQVDIYDKQWKIISEYVESYDDEDEDSSWEFHNSFFYELNEKLEKYLSWKNKT